MLPCGGPSGLKVDGSAAAPVRRWLRARIWGRGGFGASALPGGSVPLARFGAFVPASSHFLKSKQKFYDNLAGFAEFDVNAKMPFSGFTTNMLWKAFLS